MSGLGAESKAAGVTWHVRFARYDGGTDLLYICTSQAEAQAWVHKLSEGDEDAPYFWERRG